MAKSNSINESSDNVETIELSIIDTLLKKGEVAIPDFGHLELKTLGDRRTVLFKQAEDSEDSFLQLMSAVDEKDKKETNSLYTAITIPLKAEKIVNLPQIGIFRPAKREDGKIHVSYIPSSALRKLLNEGENAVKKEVKEIKEAEKEIDKISNVQESNVEVQKDEKIKDKTNEAKYDEKEKIEPLQNNNSKVIQPTNLPTEKRKIHHSKEGEIIVPQDDLPKSGRSRNISGILLFIVVVIAIIVVVLFNFFPRNNSSNSKNEVGDQTELNLSNNESNNLPALAMKHYGNPAFWVYIYDANSDKLNSPVNIPKDVYETLVIPDLKTEYGVDVTDSLAIKDANKLSDIFLTRRIKK